MLKYPPLCLSNNRQNTDGESKSGLYGLFSHEFLWQGNSITISPTHEIHAAVDADQRTSVHVADHPVVLNRQVAAILGTPGLAPVRC